MLKYNFLTLYFCFLGYRYYLLHMKKELLGKQYYAY